MASRTTLIERIEFKRKALAQARAAYIALLEGGVKSYTIGSRNLTKFDIPQLEGTIDKLEREIGGLEEELSGGRRRRAVGVIPRDW